LRGAVVAPLLPNQVGREATQPPNQPPNQLPNQPAKQPVKPAGQQHVDAVVKVKVCFQQWMVPHIFNLSPHLLKAIVHVIR